MLIAAIILGTLALVSLVVFVMLDEEEIGAVLFIIFGFLWFIAFVGSLHWSISSQELTGYIYSSSNSGGYTTAHIRFSQNAGTDAQPQFCVKTDSDGGRAIQKYTGSNTKVKVSIPSYFYFANNPFACGTTKMTIREAK